MRSSQFAFTVFIDTCLAADITFYNQRAGKVYDHKTAVLRIKMMYDNMSWPLWDRGSTGHPRKTCTDAPLQVDQQWPQRCSDFNKCHKTGSHEWEGNRSTRKQPLNKLKSSKPSNQRNLVGPVIKGSRQINLLALSSPTKDRGSV